MSDYKFVTREDILDGEDHIYSPPNEGDKCGQCGVNWGRLLAERAAFWEVAIKNWKMWRGEYEKATNQDPMKTAELKTESENSVDAEAAQILESTASRDSLAEHSQALEKGKCAHDWECGFDIKCPNICRNCGEFDVEKK